MRYISTLVLATTVACASAADLIKTAVELNKECNTKQAFARVINRCPYDVHLWSIQKGMGCPANEDNMVTLKTGESYNENYQNHVNTGVSIKISKTKQCKGNDIVQLEYFLENTNDAYPYNFLDVSYVDCLGNDCPTRSEGYYMVAGNQTGKATASAGNTWCPILSCNDKNSCSKMSYVLPDDVQTKTCDKESSMYFYMCGGEAPTEDYDSKPAPSSKPASSPSPVPTPTKDDSYKVKGAAVTPKPIVDEPKVKTEVVYVTAYEYVNAKRHAHGHARRHGKFRA